MEEDQSRPKNELEISVLRRVGDVLSAAVEAKNVDEIICALHSLAVLLFPLDPSLLSGSIDERYRSQVVSAKVASSQERSDWWEIFYRGSAFPTLARVLLYDIAFSWLACFPLSAIKHVYDVFFVDGLSTEVVRAVVPFLQHNGTNRLDNNAIRSNAERLLVLCLLENDGVLHMAKEFGIFCKLDFSAEKHNPAISRLAQLVASIPDKAHLGACAELSSHTFFKRITVQLLAGAEEKDAGLCDAATISASCHIDGNLAFIGEIFSRICRRGSADVIVSELIPRALGHVQSFLPANYPKRADPAEANPCSIFWLKLMEAIKDPYSVERMSEHILRQLAALHSNDEEAYWILWMLFYRMLCHQAIRSLFVEKFLLWKVFPVCCLRWILQFAVLECPPKAGALTRCQNCHGLLNTVRRLVLVWSKREFVQSASVEQQAYVTAAIGLSLEIMTKDELDATKDVSRSILQGVSCRLESPDSLVRRMASCVAFAFSKVVDPKNPLYLDDCCIGDTIDWGFGIITKGENKQVVEKRLHRTTTSTSIEQIKDGDGIEQIRGGNKKISNFAVVDPDEIIDPATLNNRPNFDDDGYDNSSENSESDSSLQPYDLSDDDTDLKRKITQLVDLIGALRKADDVDGVESALEVAEKLVRASPDELLHFSGDLAKALVQVRCSEVTIEGEEDSAEEKRQKALVALLVTCPFESLDALNKLLYSPNIDTSQRILILDVMTDAAEELAAAKTIKPRHQPNCLVSTISETQPWFLPSSVGPPGAGSWKEISETDSLLNYSHRYVRELPPKAGQIKRGKTRRWSFRSTNTPENQLMQSHNRFPLYAAAFMLQPMQSFDKKRHGVDMLGRDFIVLGKLIHMLGVCMKSAAMHPEASALAAPLLDMLSSREIWHHAEAYVRRSALFAASCILVSLHPSYVASALIEGNIDISKGLEWIRTFALHAVESDTDKECYMMGMQCLQLHAEMALQASREVESTATTFKAPGVGLPSGRSNFTIKIP